jgi:hypothetical protein
MSSITDPGEIGISANHLTRRATSGELHVLAEIAALDSVCWRRHFRSMQYCCVVIGYYVGFRGVNSEGCIGTDPD